MKTAIKLLKIGFGMGVFILLFLIVTNHFWPQMYLVKATPATLFKTDFVIGKSMVPTLQDGDYYTYNVSLKPEINNIVVFDCFTEKCINGDSLHGKIKRLIKINDQGCYWFEGDNKDNSWDSRNYGYLCPANDVKILGVVIN